MRKRLMIRNAEIIENSLHLYTEESVKGAKPAGQMLVDSDQFSFVYLMEEQGDYTYIVLPEQIWPLLKSSLEHNYRIMLAFQDEQVELTQFLDELKYLISNIKGNSNYGEEMVRKVESQF